MSSGIPLCSSSIKNIVQLEGTHYVSNKLVIFLLLQLPRSLLGSSSYGLLFQFSGLRWPNKSWEPTPIYAARVTFLAKG